MRNQCSITRNKGSVYAIRRGGVACNNDNMRNVHISLVNSLIHDRPPILYVLHTSTCMQLCTHTFCNYVHIHFLVN